jgi:hypothetical protein
MQRIVLLLVVTATAGAAQSVRVIDGGTLVCSTARPIERLGRPGCVRE